MDINDKKYDMLKLKKEDWLALLEDALVFDADSIALLYTVYGFPEKRATPTQLGKLLERTPRMVSAINTALGKRILDKLKVKPQVRNVATQEGNRFWNIAFMEPEDRMKDKMGHILLQIRPELVRALDVFFEKALKEDTSANDLARDSEQSQDDDFGFMEGARTIRAQVISYERNPEARSACIKHHGVRCAVCGFDFEEVYGEIGKEKIIVHHLKQLSNQRGVSSLMSPIDDMRPVCANCHLIIHSNPLTPLTIEEVKLLIHNAKKP